MRRLARTGAAVLAAAIVVTATGCSGGSKVGGAGERHVEVLKLVSFNGSPGYNPDPQLQVYADAVARRSHGSLRIALELGYRPNDIQAEKHVIRDVRTGKAELAWVGARAWESVGVDSFRPLIAPFLIDSYPLESRVFAGPLATSALDGLRGRGLVGLAVLPGPLRRVDGRKPLLRPADFRGISFGTTPTPLARATARALGTRPFALLRQVASQLPSNSGGVEAQLSAIYSNEFFTKLRYVSMNVDLWPRPLVLFANAKVYRSLSPPQRKALQLAGRDAVAGSTKWTRWQDSPANDTNLCTAERVGFPVKLLTATPADLRALDRAVQPVYTKLERDPQTRSLILRIEALKRKLGVPPDAGPPCTRAKIALVRKTTPLDGVYRQHVTAQELAARDHIPASQEDPANYGDFVWVFDRNRFAFTQRNDRACTWGYGRYVVRKDSVTQTFADGGGYGTQAVNKPGEFYIGHWSFYRDVLTIDYTYPSPGPPPPVSLTRVSTTPSRSAFFASKNCRLPGKALR